MIKTSTNKVSLTKYSDDFLERSDPLRWAVEPISCLEAGEPRYRWKGEKRVCRMNTNDDIKSGYKVVNQSCDWIEVALDRFDYTSESKKQRKKRETAGKTRRPYGRFKYHICRQVTPGPHEVTHEWLFTTYTENQHVGFIQFDFDLHLSRGLTQVEREIIEDLGIEPDYTISGLTPDEKEEQRVIFNEQVEMFIEVAERLGFADSVVWTTSPGDVVDGKWKQGLYGWIPLQQYSPVKRLRELCKQFKAFYDLKEIECSWDTKTRNIRLPGQRYVELCDPVTKELIQPVKKKSSESLAVFADAWNKAKPVSLEVIFGECRQQAKQTQRNSIHDDGSISQPKIHTHINKKVRSYNSNNIGSGWKVPTLEKSREEENTFVAAIDAKIFSRQAWKYNGNLKYLDRAVEEVKDEFVKRRPSTSNTAGNPCPFLTRVMKWHFQHFDPSKGKGQGRRLRDEEDRQRIVHCMGLDNKHIVKALDNRHLSFREKSILSEFYDRIKSWRGRVAATIIYEGGNPICSKKAWFRLLSKLKGIFIVVDQHDIDNHKCRQWALSKGFTAKVEELIQIKEQVQETIKKEREENKKGVYGTPPSSSVPPHADTVTTDSETPISQEFYILQALFKAPTL